MIHGPPLVTHLEVPMHNAWCLAVEVAHGICHLGRQ